MFSEQDWSLSDAHAGSLDHDKVVLDFTVVWEATNWIDGFFGQISLGGTVVEIDSVVVTFLTASSNGVGNSGWMPSTNTSDLSETSVRFSGKFLGTPSAGYTLSSVTLSDTNAVSVVVGGEDFVDWDLLFEETLGEVDLGSGATTVDLELDDMRFLLFEWEECHLGVCAESNSLAVLFDLVQAGVDGSFSFSPFFGVLGESQFLGSAKVLVESSFALVRNVLGPDGLEGSETSWSFDVTNNTDS